MSKREQCKRWIEAFGRTKGIVIHDLEAESLLNLIISTLEEPEERSALLPELQKVDVIFDRVINKPVVHQKLVLDFLASVTKIEKDDNHEVGWYYIQHTHAFEVSGPNDLITLEKLDVPGTSWVCIGSGRLEIFESR